MGEIPFNPKFNPEELPGEYKEVRLTPREIKNNFNHGNQIEILVKESLQNISKIWKITKIDNDKLIAEPLDNLNNKKIKITRVISLADIEQWRIIKKE